MEEEKYKTASRELWKAGGWHLVRPYNVLENLREIRSILHRNLQAYLHRGNSIEVNLDSLSLYELSLTRKDFYSEYGFVDFNRRTLADSVLIDNLAELNATSDSLQIAEHRSECHRIGIPKINLTTWFEDIWVIEAYGILCKKEYADEPEDTDDRLFGARVRFKRKKE